MAQTHILIADDEPHIANALGDFLEHKAGYRVTKASDGQEAQAILENAQHDPAGPFDLVVLDMRMPGMTGLEVLQWLRQHPTLAYTRVIMLTAAASEDDKVVALTAGADDYIVKPYHPQELLARVNTILRTQQLEKQLQQQSQQLAVLNRASNTITTTLEIRQIPAVAAAGARALLDVELAAIYLHEKELDRLVCQAADSAQEPAVMLDRFPPVAAGQGIIGRVYEQKRLFCLNEPRNHPRFQPGREAPAGITVHNLLAVPLVVRENAIGVLVAYNHLEGPFSEVDRDLLTSLGGAVSRAIENATLFRRVRARQQELQESHNQLQAVMDSILNPIYTINDQWQLMGVNQFQLSQSETTREALLGRRCYEALFDRDTPCEHCQAGLTLADELARRWSHTWVGMDHLPQEWDIHAYPIPAGSPAAPQVVMVWQDRTEERRLENSLLQAGKLAAIGQLAAGVAHEINNPLTAINANAQMLKLFIPEDDENYESVDLIARAGERAASVVRNLLDFARQNQYYFEKGDVNESIAQAMKLVSYQMQAAQVTVTCELADDLPLVAASWEHLKSVWLNLLLNARDALLMRPDQGEEGHIQVVSRLAPAGDQIQVLITDNGIGMREAQISHIFEPFYTTKDPGKGTGLGLATSHRIVAQHGGQMEVVSQPGEGSTFIVHLPIAQPAGEPSALLPEAPGSQ